MIFPEVRKSFYFITVLLVCFSASPPPSVVGNPSPSNGTKIRWPPTTITLSIAKVARVAPIIHRLYPEAILKTDAETNTLIFIASPDDSNGIRLVLNALDVKNPNSLQATVINTSLEPSRALIKKIRPLFPRSHLIEVRNHTLIIEANPADMAQIQTIIAALDMPAPKPVSSPPNPGVAFQVTQAVPKNVARALARSLTRSRVSVSGNSIVVSGPPEEVSQVKQLLDQLDKPPANVRYVSVYRLTSVDAGSVADLLSRSFPGLTFSVTKDLNAISVLASESEHAYISKAVLELDTSPSNPSGPNIGPTIGRNDAFEVIALHAVVPAASTGGSSTASDIAQTVTQALSVSAPDLKITVQPNSTRLILSGSARSREFARNLISELDIAEPLVELDTRVFEVDEGAQSQLGLKFPTAALSTTYSEITPTSIDGSTPQFLKIQPITRTPLSLGAELDFLVSNNEAKILEDPRITTFSGRTATLRAGETVNILTTAGGGTGTVATTQVQSFQTGVTLDITPVVNADDYITITLHPSVNSIAAISSAGVPNIQTRDTTTTVGLHNGETLVIGGLIEDMDTKTVQKIPILGDIPLIGKLFQDTGVSHTRNEVVVTVTPRIINPGVIGSVGHLSLLSPGSLPTISPDTKLPARESNTPEPFATPISTLPESTNGTANLSGAPTPTSSPNVVPSAFGDVNAFVFGAAPADNFAGANDPAKIFYVRAQPTLVHDGVPVTVSVITTSNVVSLTIAPNSTSKPVKLQQQGAGKWQATFAFDATQFNSSSGQVNEKLSAFTSNGNATTIQIPFSLAPL